MAASEAAAQTGAFCDNLAGYRILDLTNEAGFLAGKLLAELGTDVIKSTPTRSSATSKPGRQGTEASGSSVPFARSRPAPCLGEDDEYVYRELLGMSGDEYEALKNDGVFE